MSETASVTSRDFFSGMVERALGRAPALTPRLPMLFEPIAKPGPSDEAPAQAPIASFADPAAAADSPPRPTEKRAETQMRVEVVRERTMLAPAPKPSQSGNAQPALVAATEHVNPSPAEDRAPESQPDSRLRQDFRTPDLVIQARRSATLEPLNESSEPASAVGPVQIPQSLSSIRVVRHEQVLTTAIESPQRHDQIQPPAPPTRVSHDQPAPAATNTLMPKAVQIAPPLARPIPPRDIARILPAAAASAEPPINVTIGVVEIRAVEKAGTPAQSRTDRNHRTPMSLEDYLQRRRG